MNTELTDFEKWLYQPIPICHLCGCNIYSDESDAIYGNSKVHLECLHDLMCPDEEPERA